MGSSSFFQTIEVFRALFYGKLTRGEICSFVGQGFFIIDNHKPWGKTLSYTWIHLLFILFFEFKTWILSRALHIYLFFHGFFCLLATQLHKKVFRKVLKTQGHSWVNFCFALYSLMGFWSNITHWAFSGAFESSRMFE